MLFPIGRSAEAGLVAWVQAVSPASFFIGSCPVRNSEKKLIFFLQE
jgi:hypothetical protein